MQDATSVWAIVPVKPLAAAKSRLSPVLSRPERAALVLAMLRQTLRVLRCVEVLSGILVVSDDVRVRSMAAAVGGVSYLRETGGGGLNTALSQASDRVTTLGATGILVIPGDLPRVSPASVGRMLEEVSPPEVAIAPDRAEEGTNALFVGPPGLIPFAFGEASFQSHTREAHARGLAPRVVRDDRLATDLDRPEDLALAGELLSFTGLR